MEKSMQEVLKENRENTRYQRCLIEKARLERRKQLKENALTIFIISFIIFATITLMVNNNKAQNEAYNECIKKGHNSNYCSVVFK